MQNKKVKLFSVAGIFVVLISSLILSSSTLFAGSKKVNCFSNKKNICYEINSYKKQVAFIFDEKTWKDDLAAKNITAADITTMEVRGSFTGWASEKGYTMTRDKHGIWKVTKTFADLKKPGNSGQAEFKFVINASIWMDTARAFVPEGFVFNSSDRNHIIVYPTDDLRTIKENSILASTVKVISDFDLTTKVGQEQISNFRQVPGGTKLYRSYHPYRVFNLPTQYVTEETRLYYVNYLASAAGIKSVINLSGDVSTDEGTDIGTRTATLADGTIFSYTESYPEYMANAVKLTVNTPAELSPTGKVLYPGYNDVYYLKNGPGVLGNWIKQVVTFINADTTLVPIQIHCALGTDRTGVFSGLLAALQGASWKEIASDYQLSNNLGTKQFRDYHLLKYAFENLLGVSDISTVASLQETTAKYFIDNGYLTQPEIDAMITKLK